MPLEDRLKLLKQKKKKSSPKKKSLKKEVKKPTDKTVKKTKKPTAVVKKPVKKKSAKKLLNEQQFRDLFNSGKWDKFWKAANALYRDKFNLEKGKWHIAYLSKYKFYALETNSTTVRYKLPEPVWDKQAQKVVDGKKIQTDEDEEHFPRFLELTKPYSSQKEALAAAEQYIEKLNNSNLDWKDDTVFRNLMFRDINHYVEFLFKQPNGGGKKKSARKNKQKAGGKKKSARKNKKCIKICMI